MSALAFLSPDECGPEVALGPVLHDPASLAPVVELPRLGKLEVRGEVGSLVAAAGEQVLPLGPGRALLVVDGSPAAARERLARAGYRVYDLSAALVALEFAGENVLRRLTELEPAQLPTTGSIARGTPALIESRDGERFRLFVARELAQFVAEVVADLSRGVAR